MDSWNFPSWRPQPSSEEKTIVLPYYISQHFQMMFTNWYFWLVFVIEDEAPVEILARGPDAMHAYHKASESGTQSVFRTRLMLVGQDRVGKTSLKKALTGQR